MKISHRTCTTCTLCCYLPEIEFFAKPANTPCVHCRINEGCTIYADRPKLCRDFLCLWRKDEGLGPEWEPARSGMMVYVQGAQVTVLVDPENPERWRQEPYAGQFGRWAGRIEESGGYIIVFAGDAVFKVEPSV